MMNSEKCQALIKRRRQHDQTAMKNPDGTLKGPNNDLYLLAGDYFTGAWTKREIDLANPPDGSFGEEWFSVMEKYWFPIWDRLGMV